MNQRVKNPLECLLKACARSRNGRDGRRVKYFQGNGYNFDADTQFSVFAANCSNFALQQAFAS